jgi:hypothetical protein
MSAILPAPKSNIAISAITTSSGIPIGPMVLSYLLLALNA